MADVNDIQAGSYELVADQWDETTSKPGQPWEYTRHVRGEVVKLSQADARRLYATGSIVKPGAREEAAARQAAALLQAQLLQVPDDVRAAVFASLGVKSADEAAEALAEQDAQKTPVVDQGTGTDQAGANVGTAANGAGTQSPDPRGDETVKANQKAAKAANPAS